jgi:hypothetical protein
MLHCGLLPMGRVSFLCWWGSAVLTFCCPEPPGWRLLAAWARVQVLVVYQQGEYIGVCVFEGAHQPYSHAFNMHTTQAHITAHERGQCLQPMYVMRKAHMPEAVP